MAPRGLYHGRGTIPGAVFPGRMRNEISFFNISVAQPVRGPKTLLMGILARCSRSTDEAAFELLWWSARTMVVHLFRDVTAIHMH